MRVLYCSFRELRGVNFVLLAGGRMLVQKRCACAPTYPNMYAIPGGGIEEGESAAQAVEREVLEETGLSLDCFLPVFDIQYKIGNAQAVNRVFMCLLSEEPNIAHSEGVMEWKTLAELEGLPLALGENILLSYLKEVAYGSLL